LADSRTGRGGSFVLTAEKKILASDAWPRKVFGKD
jgi:hypothetical protein